MRRILFVCTGNTCRSVMAEGVLKKMLNDEKNKEISVSSAGIAAFPHYKIFGALEKVLKEEEIDVSNHQAKQLTPQDVMEADLILVMEKSHKNFILEKIPECRDKVFLLKEFAGEKNMLDVPDPLGRPEEVYRKTLWEIKEYLKKILPKLIAGL